MNSSELQSLRLIALFTVGIAAFLAVSGQWASAGALLGLLIVFSLFVTWRSRRFSSPQNEPKDREARVRRTISRVLPLLLVFFVALAAYDVFDEDWFGAGYAGVCFGAALVGMYFNRRRLAEIEPQRS
jgi:O-antigen/teichoic acid export membrane protein